MSARAESFGEVKIVVQFDYFVREYFDASVGGVGKRVFAVNDRKAVGCMLTLKKNNIKIGGEIGVVGFTNDPIATIISPTLTTVAEPAYDIGRISCELLLKHIHKNSFEPKEVVLPGELIIRESSQRE